MTLIQYNTSGMADRLASIGQASRPCALSWILAGAFLALPYCMPAAQLGFTVPRTTVRLAESFEVTVIAQFQPNEPAAWQGACPAMSILVGWPSGIQVIDCTWNTAAWLFDTSGWEQSETNTAIWARGNARDPRALTGAVAIATLVCIAREPDDDPFYFEVATTAWAHTTMTIIEGGALVDILGDPNDEYDGIDEVALAIASTPGYILSLAPASRIIPLTYTPLVVQAMIRPVSEAAPYDHVRVELEYNATVFALTNVAALCASVPSFFSAVEIHCPAGGELPPVPPGCVIITNCGEDELFVELWCAPTNYAGALFSWQLLPQSIYDNSELTIGFTHTALFSAVSCYGIDLLGMCDDEEDGVESTDITVRFTDGLRVFLESTTPYGYLGSTTFARVMLAKSVTAPVQLDCLDVEMFFDPALLACASNAFCINPALALAVSGQYQTVFATNTFVADPTRPDSLWYPWTSTAVRIQVNLAADLLVTQDLLCIGTFAFTPLTNGTVGFVRGDISIMINLDDMQDENACGGGWPFALGVADDRSAQRSVTIALERDGPANAAVKPGDRANYSIVSYGDALQDAAIDVRWVFDAAGVMFQTSTFVTVEPLVINAATTAAVRIQGTASTAATTCLARIQFTALKPGTLLFAPVSYALSSSDYCRVTEFGLDVLGAPGVPGDGVLGANITVATPDPVELVFEPNQTLFAGVQSAVALAVVNPNATYWDTLTSRILLDADSVMLLTNALAAQLQEVQPLAFSNAIMLVSNVSCVTLVSNVYYGTLVSNAYYDVLVSNVYYDATLALRVTATNATAIIATLPLIPMDEVFWNYDTATNASNQSATDVRFDGMSVMDANAIDNIALGKWTVYPHGANIYIGDSALPPVLGSNYVLTVRISNPNGVALQRVTFAYAFDATVMEVSTPLLAPGLSTNAGGVWFSNSSENGYLCGDIWCDTVTTARDVAVLHVTIRPKLNQTIELLPASIAISNEREIGMGLWTAQQFNVLALFNEIPDALCQAWHRGVVWLDIPQVSIDDKSLAPFESSVMQFKDILKNSSTNKTCKWWVEGAQDHVSADFSLPNQTLTLTSLDNWNGSVQFRLYCQELGSPYISETFFTVFVEGDTLGDTLDLIVQPRDEFVAAIGSTFDKCAFTIVNATGAVLVTAAVATPGMTNAILVRDDAAGVSGAALDIRGNGQVVWNTQGFAPGPYRGCISVRYSPTGLAVTGTFFVELFTPGQDDDGDTYFLQSKSPGGRQEIYTGRTVEIKNGTDLDVLTMKVTRGPEGDGLVTLDSIVSDHGLKKMQLEGMVHTITLNGPLGAFTMDGGSIGQLTVTRGGIGTILIHTCWLKQDLAFAENVGIVRGVSAVGSIKKIMVVGGAIGSVDAPALIYSASGSIGSVATLLKQHSYADNGRNVEVSSADGANICASIEAPNGSIGKVFANGGSIGTPYDYPLCTLRAAGGIKIVRAMADVYDGTPLGGSIFAAIDAGGAVGRLDAIGGDITRSEISDPNDISNSEHLPVRFAARSIKSLKTLLRLSNYDKEKIAYGGNLHATIDVQSSIDTIMVVGGHACLLTSVANTPSYIKSLIVRRANFTAEQGANPTIRGGDLLSSSITTTAGSQAYKSSMPVDYHGPLLKLDVDGAISNSWIGFAGDPTLPSAKFHYGSLESSEIWVNGKVCEMPATLP